MGNNMFDLDDSLLKEKDVISFKDELKKANIFCMREQFDKALEIYNKIIEEDMENEEAYIGLLKVHSQYYTIYEGEQIEKDIRIIERMFPDSLNEEYASYVHKRKQVLMNKKETNKKTEENVIKEEKETKTKQDKEQNNNEANPNNKASKNKSTNKEEKDNLKAVNKQPNPEIITGFKYIDKSWWTKANKLFTDLYKKSGDIYALYGLAEAYFIKGDFNNCKDYFIEFLKKASTDDPFYYYAALKLGYTYSGISGSGIFGEKVDCNPQEAYKYFKIAYEVSHKPLAKYYMNYMSDCINDELLNSCCKIDRNIWLFSSDYKFEYAKQIREETILLISKLLDKGYDESFLYSGYYAYFKDKKDALGAFRAYLESKKVNKDNYRYIMALRFVANNYGDPKYKKELEARGFNERNHDLEKMKNDNYSCLSLYNSLFK